MRPFDIERRHEQALDSWTTFLQKPDKMRPPQDSLLSCLADALRWLDSRGRRDAWGDVLTGMGLVSPEDGTEINHLLTNAHRPEDFVTSLANFDQKTWAVFVQVVCVLGAPPDALNLEQLNTMCDWVSKEQPGRGPVPRFVRRCWDGYFLYCRAVARRFLDEDRGQWTLDIPGVQASGWRMLTRRELEDSSAWVWTDIKNCPRGRIEVRYARNEYQMPALWWAAKRTDRGSGRFSAVREPKRGPLKFRDMALASARTLAFADDKKSQTSTKRGSFDLPGLLWAMALDGGMRRSSEFATFQTDLQKQLGAIAAPLTMNKSRSPLASEVLPVVKEAVASLRSHQHRLASSEALIQTGGAVLVLDGSESHHEWFEEDQLRAFYIQDTKSAPLSRWRGGTFFDTAGGRTMPVVFGVEDSRGNLQDWVWGSSDEWGLDDDGVTRFVVWPMVDADHTLRQAKVTPFVVQATMLDLTGLGPFPDGYCVLFVRVSLI